MNIKRYNQASTAVSRLSYDDRNFVIIANCGGTKITQYPVPVQVKKDRRVDQKNAWHSHPAS